MYNKVLIFSLAGVGDSILFGPALEVLLQLQTQPGFARQKGDVVKARALPRFRTALKKAGYALPLGR